MEEAIFESVDMFKKNMSAPKDDSTLFGEMIASQHRLLNKTQKTFFMRQVQLSYIDALNMQDTHDYCNI